MGTNKSKPGISALFSRKVVKNYGPGLMRNRDWRHPKYGESYFDPNTVTRKQMDNIMRDIDELYGGFDNRNHLRHLGAENIRTPNLFQAYPSYGPQNIGMSPAYHLGGDFNIWSR